MSLASKIVITITAVWIYLVCTLVLVLYHNSLVAWAIAQAWYISQWFADHC
jgi:hypothetical protein